MNTSLCTTQSLPRTYIYWTASSALCANEFDFAPAADTLSCLLPASPVECKWRSSCTDQKALSATAACHSRLRLHKCKMQRIVYRREPNGEPVYCMPSLASIRMDSSFDADNVNTKMMICSRHFTDDCFKHGKFLGIVINWLITVK